MAFKITAALALQPPSAANMAAVRNAIVAGLGQGLAGLSRTVRVSVDRASLTAAQRNIQQLNALLSQTINLNNNVRTSSQGAGTSLRSLFGGIAGAGSVIAILRSATSEALDFNAELIKTKQLTSQTWQENKRLGESLLDLAADTSTASAELAKTYRFIISAGVSAKDAGDAIGALAKAAQSATFGTLEDSTEAVLALFNSFHATGKEVGQDLDVITALSSRYAVESNDIVTGLKKSGVVLHSLGADFKDFASLFTVVRSTTRENSESIGNSLKSIFTYAQRGSVRKFLKENLGVDTRELTGDLKTPVKLIQELQSALAGKSSRSPIFGQLGDLFGLRNISRTLPLLLEQEKLTRILATAQNAQGSVDAQLAEKQDTLAFKFGKVREQLVKLVYEVGNNKAFQDLANVVVKLSESLIGLGTSLNGLTSIHLDPTILELLGGAGGAALLTSGRGPLAAIGGAGLFAGFANSAINRSGLSRDNKAIASASVTGLLPLAVASQFTRNPGLLGIAAGAGIHAAGSQLAQQQIDAGKFGQGRDIGLFSSTLGLGLSGAAGGFKLGGPLGGIAGGLAGSAFGFFNAKQDLADSIRAAKLGRASTSFEQELSKSLESKTGVSPDLFAKANRFVFAGGNAAGHRGDFEQLRGNLIGQSKTFEDFQSKGGNVALALLADASNLSAKEMRDLVASTRRQIEVQNALSSATVAFQHELLTIADTVNQAHAETEQTNRRVFARNTGAHLDLNSLDFASTFGANSGQLKAANAAIPGIVRAAKSKGNIDNVIPSTLTGEVADLLEASLEEFRDTIGHIKPEEITKKLGASLSDFTSTAHAGSEARRGSIGAQLGERSIARDALIHADAASSLFGSSDVTKNIFGRSLSAGQLSRGIATNQAGILGLNQQALAHPENAPELLRERDRLVTAMSREVQALDLLSSSTGNLSKRQEELDRQRAKIAPETDIQTQLTFGSFQDKSELTRRLGLADRVGNGSIGLSQIADEDKQGLLGIFNQFGTSKSRLFGGKTGAQVRDTLIKQETGFSQPLQLTLQQQQINTERERLDIVKQEADVERAKLALWQSAIAGNGPGHATGGLISGASGTDKVPAMLTSGEFVLRKGAVERLGVANLYAINGGHGPRPGSGGEGGTLQHFAEGGAVDFEALGRDARDREAALAAHTADVRKQVADRQIGLDAQTAASTANAGKIAATNKAAQDAANEAASRRAREIYNQNADAQAFAPSATEAFRRGKYGNDGLGDRTFAFSGKALSAEYSRRGLGDIAGLNVHNASFGDSGFSGNGPLGNIRNLTSAALAARVNPNPEFAVASHMGQDPRRDFAVSHDTGSSPSVAASGAGVGGSQLDISAFSATVTKLDTTLKQFDGLSVDHKFSGTLEVVVNGASILADLGPKFEEIAKRQMQEGIENMLARKFPAVGTMGYPQRKNAPTTNGDGT